MARKKRIESNAAAQDVTDTAAIEPATPAVTAVPGKNLKGTGRADHLNGGAGDDALTGKAGDDVLKGGAGNDTLDGGNGNDKLYGGNGNDMLSGGSGRDRLLGGAGADQLFGNAGDDRLYGGAGDDILNGGAGNDYLNGGAGNDRYQFGRGDGHDVLVSTDKNNTDENRLVLGSGIAHDQLWLERTGKHLKLTLMETGDTLTVRGWYSDPTHRLDCIELASGEQLADSRVEKLVQAMSAFEAPASGAGKLPPDVHAALKPVLAASWL